MAFDCASYRAETSGLGREGGEREEVGGEYPGTEAQEKAQAVSQRRQNSTVMEVTSLGGGGT